MSNMSYCRFENTFGDMKDCLDSLEHKPFSELSDWEQSCAEEMIEVARHLAEAIEEQIY